MGIQSSIIIKNECGDTVYAKVEKSKRLLKSRKMALGAGAGAGGVTGNLRLSNNEEFDNHVIKSELTRIPAYGYQNFAVGRVRRKIYITVITCQGKPLCNRLPKFNTNHFIVHKSGNLCDAYKCPGSTPSKTTLVTKDESQPGKCPETGLFSNVPAGGHIPGNNAGNNAGNDPGNNPGNNPGNAANPGNN